MTLLMLASCHLDRCSCKIYHNAKAIQVGTIQGWKACTISHALLSYARFDSITFDSLLDANARSKPPRTREIQLSYIVQMMRPLLATKASSAATAAHNRF